MRVFVATNKSRELLRKARLAEKKGEKVDWEDVLNQVVKLGAKTADAQIRAIAEKKK